MTIHYILVPSAGTFFLRSALAGTKYFYWGQIRFLSHLTIREIAKFFRFLSIGPNTTKKVVITQLLRTAITLLLGTQSVRARLKNDPLKEQLSVKHVFSFCWFLYVCVKILWKEMKRLITQYSNDNMGKRAILCKNLSL